MAEIPTVNTLTTNLRRIAALPHKKHPLEKGAAACRFCELARRPAAEDQPEEKQSDYRVRALAVIGSWWPTADGRPRSGDTVRSMQDGHRNGKDSPEFCRDLQRYGACVFDEETGALDPASLDRGPDELTYLRSLPARKSSVPPRRKKSSRRSARA